MIVDFSWVDLCYKNTINNNMKNRWNEHSNLLGLAIKIVKNISILNNMKSDQALLVLEDKDIAQIDATVIVGVLIFLALAIEAENLQQTISILTFTLIIIAPFSISAILATFSRLRSAKIIMSIGFGLLMTFFILGVLILNVYGIVGPNN